MDIIIIMNIFMWSVVTCVDPLGAEAGLASGHFVRRRPVLQVWAAGTLKGVLVDVVEMINNRYCRYND